MTSLTREQVREFDRRAAAEFGLPTRVLMENAGRGAADLLIRLGAKGPVVVCCGKGNNGGDGLVLARHLALANLSVSVTLFAEVAELSADVLGNWRALKAAPVRFRSAAEIPDEELRGALDRAEWVVDALFGIGLARPVRPPLDRLIEAINACPADVFALDIPTGLDADTGEPLGPTIRARHTATFVAPKRGFANPASAQWTGEVHVVDVGASLSILGGR